MPQNSNFNYPTIIDFLQKVEVAVMGQIMVETP